MIIFFDENGIIESYVDFGEIEVSNLNKVRLPEKKIPENFREDFKPSLFIYNGNSILKNQFYKPPALPTESPSRIQVLEEMVETQSSEVVSLRDNNETLRKELLDTQNALASFIESNL